MGEYAVFFVTKISAKNEKDLSRKAEKIENTLSISLGKRVYAHGYTEIEKQDKIKTMGDDDS